ELEATPTPAPCVRSSTGCSTSPAPCSKGELSSTLHSRRRRARRRDTPGTAPVPSCTIFCRSSASSPLRPAHTRLPTWTSDSSSVLAVETAPKNLAGCTKNAESGLWVELMWLLAIMEVSAQTILLADKPRSGCPGHQFSRAPGRPLLHFFL